MGIRGITPHSYRYARAKRATVRIHLERFAQAALGHNCKASLRWTTAAKDRAFDLIRRAVVADTRPETLIAVLHSGTVSTNVQLRKLHNYCLDMGWLPWPIIPKRQRAAVRYGETQHPLRRASRNCRPRAESGTPRSLRALLATRWCPRRHREPDRLGHRLGTPDGSVPPLENKLAPLIRFGEDVDRVLRQIPASSPPFPYLLGVRPFDRATEIKQCGRDLGIEGVTLNS